MTELGNPGAGGWRRRGVLETLNQPMMVPVGDAMVRILDLPAADAGRIHDELVVRAPELYDAAIGEAFHAAIAQGFTGATLVDNQHPMDWLTSSPMMGALYRQAGRGPVTFDPSELDHIAAELRRTEGTPMIVDGETVQNRELE